MNILIALNYQREIPPFMLTELEMASQVFDQVIYVTRELESDNSVLIRANNVKVIQMCKSDRILSLLQLPFMFFRKEIRHEVLKAISHTAVPLKYLRHLGKELYCSQNLYHAALPVVKDELRKNHHVTIQATWFDVCAYATARIKRKYSETQAISLAHSFEIDPGRSSFIGLNCDQYKLKKLDKIYFIAKGMKEVYVRALPNWIQYDKEKMLTRYLGSLRYFSANVQTTANDIFTICTCSGAVKLKRIDIIINALALLQCGPVQWIHIGGGPLLEPLNQLAKTILKDKTNIEYRFIGHLENIDVHKYYRDHQVDLFLNVSESEGVPVSIMEAMSYGIPAMATNVGATCELVQDKRLLLPKELTPQLLADRITWFYTLPKCDKVRIRRMSEKIWETNFNADYNAKQYYKKLVQRE